MKSIDFLYLSRSPLKFEEKAGAGPNEWGQVETGYGDQDH